MKAFLFSILLFLVSFTTFAQKVSFGISMGLNQSDFDIEQDLSLGNQVESLKHNGKFGFNIGIHSLIPIANRVKLSPQLLLDFNERNLEVSYGTGETVISKIEDVQIRIPIDLQLELLKGKTALYLISGIEYVTSIAQNEPRSPIFDYKKSFWSGRIGVGGRKDFQRFSVSPELTFSKSISDIEEDNTLVLNQVVTNLNNSILGLSIKFQGLLSK